ncbi:glycosyltransferase family 2 protein [Desulfallas thermosapovorans]|uniref:Glycosyltransferase involved in cell wall biosynthesis n=1 Tax=Desulfallas thermosapovorans DSM 6562 TaxID=1121431 RepID=A0A5S4ZUM7_9FIRM|nr:glycosyltransferase family 2 protein [Desulfallas thermosapovorans]TYO96599.1 glycosyltransferase involved in cell wall biosynthesis [Desulfallas thermosapovorans DSM 6562]
MKKLIVQIPCYNEEKTLPLTVADIPRKIPGIDKVEILIIDDGSSDKTVEVAREIGVDHIVSFPKNKGLARAFAAGLNACLRLGADIIVNTDGDNQYNGADIPKLIRPILEGRAEIVIGDRQVETIDHFSKTKIMLQKLGSWVVRKASSTDVPDTTSGFRAYSRDAALQINVTSDYTYTLETIISAGHRRMGIESVPISTNEKLRESRLFSSIRKYVSRSAATIIRIYTMYQPLKVFMGMGIFSMILGSIIGIRYLVFYFMGQGIGHIQSLILMAVLLIMGFQLIIFGMLADLIANNRKLNEQILTKVRKIDADINKGNSLYLSSMQKGIELIQLRRKTGESK